MIRLLLVEDQPAVRKGLHMRLSAESDFSVIGEASDCESAADLMKTLRPDIVLVDVETPCSQGVTTAKALRLICQRVPVIVLSLHDDALARARAEDAGAAAFVAKSMPADTLLTTIRQVMH